MVDSSYCLDWFVPEGISQVSRRSEVGNTKQRSLNTRLSSGTSAGTFAVSAGPYRNYHVKVGTKNKPWHVFGTISKKGLKIDHHVLNLRTLDFLFQGVQVHLSSIHLNLENSSLLRGFMGHRPVPWGLTDPTPYGRPPPCGIGLCPTMRVKPVPHNPY